MIRKTILSVAIVTSFFLQAQENCVPQEAGNSVGEIGCVSFKYRNQDVHYKTVRAADGNEWLLQNLGSTKVAESISDEEARGDYFQWGRWDDGHQLKDSELSEKYPDPNNPLGLGAGNELFYVGGGSPWNGNYTGWFANPNQDDTWNAANLDEVTAHNGMDPCKAIGSNWEIPTEEDWDIVMQKENIFPKPEGATNNGMTRAFESNLKIAGAGARKENTFAFEGQRAYLWTKSASNNPNFYRYVYLGTYAGSTTGFGGDAKSFGYSVRCVNKSNSTLGVHNAEVSNTKIVPNPTKDFVQIKTSSIIKNVQIYSASGSLVKELSNAATIDISILPKGIYLLKINHENGTAETQKLLKN